MKKLFFIALLPPLEIQEEVTQFKQIAAKKFSSTHALNSPPHITLFPPFKLESQEVQTLQDALINFSNSQAPFPLFLKNFNTFAPRVIYIDVERAKELINLQKALINYMDTEMELKHRSRHGFNPHMTVAFRDLERTIYDDAWAYFSQQTFERFFTVDQLVLLRHNGKVWEIFKNYSFNP